MSKIPPLIPKGDIYMQDVQHFKGHTALKSLGHDYMCHLNKFFKKIFIGSAGAQIHSPVHQ